MNIHFQPNPGGGANNPNLITNSGLAQPLIGHFGTLGRNVVRLNPLVESDLTLGRIFKLRPEGVHLKLQAQFFKMCLTTRHSVPSVRPFHHRLPSATTQVPTRIRGRLRWQGV